MIGGEVLGCTVSAAAIEAALHIPGQDRLVT
jgi:hypothetical protein